MARKNNSNPEVDAAFDSPGKVVLETPLHEEAQRSFLEYSYSVIHSRALPDARDGLKPVHRRILFGMYENGLRPDHAHVKSARVVGDVMGKYHPHGDSAIYDALVRLAQDFSQNTVLIDGHGNFGSPNDSAAAMRYTECRMASPAMLLVEELGENTVDFGPNYDGSMQEPKVLPAAFPNLLVNGASGIAVGMATNMIPHNLGEVIAAARLLIKKPKADLDELMELVPGPDLPTGGVLLGMDQVRAAYESGRGTVRIRGRAEIGPLEGSRGRMAITFVELPYAVGTEKVIESIKAEIGKKRLQGISDVKDLTDRVHGTRLVVECKAGVNPNALLAELYKYTPLEQSFGIANLALVDGQPKLLGLKELLEVFLAHRYDVITRRTTYRLEKAEARKHIVEGLLKALDNIDAVVKLIRSSKDTAEARENLIKRFKLSDIQAGHILDMPLRRLVALEVETLRKELADLIAAIAGFNKILGDDKVLRQLVDKELAAVADRLATPRRTALMDGDLKEVLAASAPAGPVEVADEPCTVLLSVTGLLARTAAKSEETIEGRKRSGRAKHDAILAAVQATSRGQVLVVTSKGRGIRVDVLSIPALPVAAGTISLRGTLSIKEVVSLAPGERVVGLAPLTETALKGSPGLAMGTKQGVVKVSAPDWPVRSDDFEVIALKPGDEVVRATWLTDGTEELVFLSSDSSLLHYPAKNVRPQGRSGGGMVGINLAARQTVVAFAAVRTDDKVHGAPMVVTSTGISTKVTPLAEYPGKGRGTGGVRSHRFLKGEDQLIAGWIGPRPVATLANGDPLDLPDIDKRRDGSGAPFPGVEILGHFIQHG